MPVGELSLGDYALVLGLLAAWIVLQLWVLPMLGVQT